MDIVIVGNGVAGITCALRARERDPAARITVVSPESDYFFSRTALMYAFMDRLGRKDLEPYERRVWDEKRVERVRDRVVDLDAGARTVRLERGGERRFDRLVLAVGAEPVPAPWPGVEAVRDGLVHFVSLQDLDDAERLVPATRRAVVVGGGLIGVELVECLVHHGIETTFLVREPWYWPAALGKEEADRVSEHLRARGVDLRLGTEVERVVAGEAGRVSGLVTRDGERIPCGLLGVAIGVRPRLGDVRGFTTPPRVGRGIVVDETLKTSLPGVFACGDCAEVTPAGGAPTVELLWYSAKRQGRACGDNLFGDGTPYRPPLFFNSSRFFDLDFTTVGRLMSLPVGTPTIFLDAPGSHASVRLVHDGERLVGFNGLGSRWDHAVIAAWIEGGRPPRWCLDHLAEAQFDVEFGRAPFHRARVTELPLAPWMS